MRLGGKKPARGLWHDDRRGRGLLRRPEARQERSEDRRGRAARRSQARCSFLLNVGLDYLSLDRSGQTLSGGEAQRIRLASQVGSELTGVLYVLDEPSIGLHQRDNQRLIGTLQHLRDIGNTVIVVEHDEETIRAADCVVDFGPLAGELGGEVVFAGRRRRSLCSRTRQPHRRYLSGKKSSRCREAPQRATARSSPSAARAPTTSRTSTSRSPSAP